MKRYYVRACEVNNLNLIGFSLWASEQYNAKEIVESWCFQNGISVEISAISTNNIIHHLDNIKILSFDYCQKFQIKLFELAYNLKHPKLGTIRRFARVKAVTEYEAKVLANDWFAQLGWEAIPCDDKIGYDHEFLNINWGN